MIYLPIEIVNEGAILAIDLGFSATLADSLMRHLVRDNIGIHFFGKDYDKLNLISILACSVSSNPSQDIHEWSTPTKIDKLATQCQNKLLCLERLENSRPKHETGMTAWALAEGIGKETYYKPADRWSNAFLSTGSVGVPEHIANTNRRLYQCEMIRMLHIPIDYITCETKYPDYHEDYNDSWGVAGQAFVNAIKGNEEDFVDSFNGHVDEISAVYTQKESDNVAVFMRAARKFAFIATAGEFAIEHSITSWNKGTSLNVAKRCYSAWLTYSNEIRIFKNK